MATLTIRNVDSGVKDRLRIRAARNRRSLEAELRIIIAEAAGSEAREEVNLAEAIRRLFAPLGGVDDLQPHPYVTAGDPVIFEP
jgi:plasmid stability protein